MRFTTGRTILWRCAGLIALALSGNAAAQGLSHAPDPLLHNGFESPNAAPVTAPDAARFLAQATFGPTLAEIDRLRGMGYSAWLNEQFAAAPSYELVYLDWIATLPPGPSAVVQRDRVEAWLRHAIGGADPGVPGLTHNDQLRQRVAFALSEIFVISDNKVDLPVWAVASYYDMLVRNAFGNYRELLEDVTLHPAMGNYLSMLGNRRPDPLLNIRPDENYAREILQLFSVGLQQLNADGTAQLIGGQPIPTYTQAAVRGFAHVFTGWHYSGCAEHDFHACWPYNNNMQPWRVPAVAYDSYHDSGNSKQLLDYPGVSLISGVLPAGGTTQQDLEAALDNIFGHPNVGAFISRQLIQRLVTSNPSPTYVARVAALFNNNGSGVRGDLGAVVRGILLDSEARYGQLQMPTTFGKLREPLLKLTHALRALDARSQNGRIEMFLSPEESYGQGPLRAPSVFNFFRPDYAASGEVRAAGLSSPEFQIAGDSLIVSATNDLGRRLYYWYIGSDYEVIRDVPAAMAFDFSRDAPLATSPAALLERYNLLFLSGQMSPFMRETLLQRLNGMANSNGGRDRVQQALYLILSSPEYAIQK